MAIRDWLLAVRASMRPAAADATFALFFGFFIAIVIESLALSGVVTVNGAFIALGVAWVVGIGSTFFLDHIWPVTGKDRIVFSAFLAVFLLAVGFVEYQLHPIEAAQALTGATANTRPVPQAVPLDTVPPQATQEEAAVDPELVKSMTNEDLRRAAYRAADDIDVLTMNYFRQERLINEQKISDRTEDEKIQLDTIFSNKFRKNVKLYLTIYREFKNRGVRTEYEDHWILSIAKPGIISVGSIVNFGEEIKRFAKELP